MDTSFLFWVNVSLLIWIGSGILARGNKNTAPLSNEHRLMQVLFRSYDKEVRPRYNSSESVMVKVRFSLQQINDLDEKRQILKISGWLTAEWQDDFLKWSPEEFGGLHTLVVSPARMWVPKLAIGNSANKLFDADHYKRFWITVRSNGAARWQPGGVFAIACALDMNFYPFDDQKCTIEIETWVYTSDKVNLTNSQSEIGLDTYIPHGEWTIIKTSVTSSNVIYRYYLQEAFPEVYCTIYIRRKYTFYFMYILMPCLMLSGVLLMIFLLPAQSGEKVSLGVSILVAISVFLLLVAGNVPDTSDAIPIIAIYLTYFMMVTTLSVAVSVLVIKFHYKSPDHPPPQWARVLVFHYLARLVCMDSHGTLASLLEKTHSPFFSSGPSSSRPRRDLTNLTWSGTMTEDISRESRDIMSPDGCEQYELMQSSRNLHHHHQHQHTGLTYPNMRRNNVRESSMNSNSSMDGMDAYQRRKHNGIYSRARLSLNEYMDEDHEATAEKNKMVEVNEWKKIAEVLDRVFFYFFLIFFLILPTTTILGIVRLFKPEL